MLVHINESEIRKHIAFVKQQNDVYKYHNHPDLFKMQSLYDFLNKLYREGKENETCTSSDKLQQFDGLRHSQYKIAPVVNEPNKPISGQQSLFQ